MDPSPWGHKESDTTGQLSLHFILGSLELLGWEPGVEGPLPLLLLRRGSTVGFGGEKRKMAKRRKKLPESLPGPQLGAKHCPSPHSSPWAVGGGGYELGRALWPGSPLPA